MNMREIIRNLISRIFHGNYPMIEPTRQVEGIEQFAGIQKKPVQNYGEEINNAKNNLLKAYNGWNNINNEKREDEGQFMEEYKKMLVNLSNSKKKMLWHKVLRTIAEIVSKNEDINLKLMDKLSYNIDDIYRQIKDCEISVRSRMALFTDDLHRMTNTNREKYAEDVGKDRELRTSKEYIGKFEDILIKYMECNVEAEIGEGQILIPKKYTDEEKKEIIDFIRLLAKHTIKDFRYYLSLQEFRAEGYASDFALIKALSPDLELTKEIKEKYQVDNIEEYKVQAIGIMDKHIAECIKSVVITSFGKDETENKENIDRVTNFLKSQIITVTGLIANTKDENEFIEKLSMGLKKVDLIPLRIYLAHLWRAARVISPGNTLNTDFVDFRPTGNGYDIEPILISLERKSTKDKNTLNLKLSNSHDGLGGKEE